MYVMRGIIGFFAIFDLDLVFDFLDISGSRLWKTVQDHPGIRAWPQARQLFGTVFGCDCVDGFDCRSWWARKADACGDVERSTSEAAWRCFRAAVVVSVFFLDWFMSKMVFLVVCDKIEGREWWIRSDGIIEART